ncbi:MAG: phage tail tape measure C-terminal domain-containing protein, partial [Porticoccaceae bacterium]
KAVEAGDELGEMNRVDFASGLNKEIQDIVNSLGQVSNVIPDSTIPAIESISDLRLGFKSWSDSLPSMQENMQNLTKQGLDGLTDSLTAGITGATDFADAMKAMAKSVVDSLIKMLIQKYIVDAAFGFITSSFGTGGTGSTGSGATSGGGLGMGQGYSNTAAIGGPVFQGERTLVGERGPEIFVPNANGSIIPNHKLGGDGVTINQTINVTTGVQQTVRA